MEPFNGLRRIAAMCKDPFDGHYHVVAFSPLTANPSFCVLQIQPEHALSLFKAYLEEMELRFYELYTQRAVREPFRRYQSYINEVISRVVNG